MTTREAEEKWNISERRMTKTDKLENYEKMLLGILYEFPELCQQLGLEESFFSVVDHGLLYRMIQTGKGNISVQMSPEQQRILSEIAVRELHLQDSEKAAKQLMEAIRQQKNQREMAQGNTNAEKLQQLLMQDKRSKHKCQVREGE